MESALVQKFVDCISKYARLLGTRPNALRCKTRGLVLPAHEESRAMQNCPQPPRFQIPRYGYAIVSVLLLQTLGGCAHQELSKPIASTQVKAATIPYSGPLTVLALGQFANKSNYMRGAFSDRADRLGTQAQTVLIGHLQQSRRFQVLDRNSRAEVQTESTLRNIPPALPGAAYLVTGDVTEFGRKEVGDQQLFGILGRGKTQVAYAKVLLNIVDTRTAAVVFSTQGAGEFSLSEREVIGFGGTASYDSTLNGKVLDLAIREAVNALVDGLSNGSWQPLP